MSVESGEDPAEALLAAVRRQGVRRTSVLPIYIRMAEALEAALEQADHPLETPLPSEHAGRGIEWAINAYPPGTQSFQMRLTAW